MELEIPSTEEPVATRRNIPLAISDVDHFFSIINAIRLFRLGQREGRSMYSGLTILQR